MRRLALAACWNGVFVVGATTWAMSFAQQAFSASTAALAYAMEPLFAALFAAAILHESIHELQLLGGTLVVSPAPDTDTDTDTALLGREHSWRSPTGLAPDPALAPAPA